MKLINNEKITIVNARKLLQFMNLCCKGLIFTKDEAQQIALICLKAVEREEGKQGLIKAYALIVNNQLSQKEDWIRCLLEYAELSEEDIKIIIDTDKIAAKTMKMFEELMEY